ncbi:YraN family protein [Vibrio sp. S11_S32]|uniref:YraN family protein n=1 Tax=Vibrio sp. S11_S32 TaxID=2720225 RepID=UPI001680A0E8|nr:YraN family protein [Vibrio sp. S11_S32]MBD1576892.1 YraN family protein [Vibrio sp. S11_S32]
MKLFSQSKTTTTNNKRAIGSQYETLAKQYLTRQGYRFIAANFNTRLGEIDLIMQDGDTFVFIEVKYRKHSHYGHAAEMVTYAKSQKLIKTAIIWLKQQRLSAETTSFRFDVIAIQQQGQDINWIKNAITQG